MNEFFYNFQIAGENRGYSYLYLDSSKLYSFTRFATANTELLTNIFTLRLSGESVLACKHNSLGWVDLKTYPPNHLPSCAYPLMLPKVKNIPYAYVQITEHDGSVVGETELTREVGDIVETQSGVVRRRFTMDGDIPIRIDWGGAISQLCSDSEECVRGAGVKFVYK